MDSSTSTDADTNVVIAKLIALAARNGVEDLHAKGAFSDRQAPALNRLLRGWIYEFFLATSRSEVAFVRFVDELAEGQRGGRSVVALGRSRDVERDQMAVEFLASEHSELLGGPDGQR